MFRHKANSATIFSARDVRFIYLPSSLGGFFKGRITWCESLLWISVHIEMELTN
jgi:hypothetical protein